MWPKNSGQFTSPPLHMKHQSYDKLASVLSTQSARPKAHGHVCTSKAKCCTGRVWRTTSAHCRIFSSAQQLKFCSLSTGANMFTQATKSYDISDLWACRNSKHSRLEGGQRHWLINRNSICFHCFSSSQQNRLQELLAAIRVGLLMVSWADRGLDFEIRGG